MLKSLGIEGIFLALLKVYLSDWSLNEVVGGKKFERDPINAGSLLTNVEYEAGPLKWNILFDDLHHKP